jgi:hypothetical protein
MDAIDVIEIVTNKLDQLATGGQLAELGYAPVDVITREGAGVLHLQSFPRARLEEVVEYLTFYLQEKGANVSELFLVIDSYTDPTQGTILSDVVVIVHCQASQKFKVGLIEYDLRSYPLVRKEVNWSNPYWTEEMSALGQTINRYLGKQTPEAGHRVSLNF